MLFANNIVRFDKKVHTRLANNDLMEEMMRAQTLTLERIFEDDFHFDLSAESIAPDEMQKICQGIKLVLSGDDTRSQGIAKFSFACKQDSYQVVRNFDTKTISISKNDDDLKMDTSDLYRALFGIDEQVFDQVFMLDENRANSILQDASPYLDTLLSLYNLDSSALEQKCNEYKNDIQNYEINLAFLQKKKEKLAVPSDDKKLAEDIDKLKCQISDIEQLLFLAERAKADKIEWENLQKEWQECTANNDKAVEYQTKLDKYKQSEQAALLVAKQQQCLSQNEKLDKDIASLNASLSDIQAKYQQQQTSLDQLEQEYLAASQSFQDSAHAFLQGAKFDKEDDEFYQRMSSYYEEYDEKAQELSQTLTELAQQHQQLSDSLAEVKLAQENKFSAVVKKEVRSSIVLAAQIENKSAFIDKTNGEIDEANASIERLQAQIARNKKELAVAKSKSEEKLGRDITYKLLYEQLNEDEKHKQTLYRNQIIIANTEREIGAVDNKIYQNQEAQRSYLEDKKVLQNAKETLLSYIKKLHSKIKGIEDKLIAITAQKKYHDTISSATFGDKCPVCKGTILSKTDFGKESKLIDKAYNELLEEKQKAMEIKTDYDMQMEKVNIRLGELSNRIDTSISYLASLKETKDAKYQLIKKLLSECKVKSFAALTEALDAAIKRVAITTNEFIEASRHRLVEKSLQTNIDFAEKEIKRIQDVVLKNANALKKSAEESVESYTQQMNGLATSLGDISALEKIAILDASEVEEEELSAQYQDLAEQEAQLLQQIAQIERQLVSIASRDDTILVEKDGESLTYPQLFIALLKENCEQKFDVLAAADKDKQQLQTRYMEALRGIKEKEQELYTLQGQIASATANKDANVEIVALLNQSASAVEEQDLSGDEKISAEQEKEMSDFVEKHSKDTVVLRAKIDDLEQKLEIGNNYMQSYDENLAQKNALTAKLAELKDLLLDNAGAKANFDFVINAIAFEQNALVVAQTNLTHAKAILGKDITLLLSKTKQSDAKTTVAKIASIIGLEKIVADIANNDRQLLQRFIVIDKGKLSPDDINGLKVAASTHNIDIVISE